MRVVTGGSNWRLWRRRRLVYFLLNLVLLLRRSPETTISHNSSFMKSLEYSMVALSLVKWQNVVNRIVTESSHVSQSRLSTEYNESYSLLLCSSARWWWRCHCMKLYPCTDPDYIQREEIFTLEWRCSNYILITNNMYCGSKSRLAYPPCEGTDLLIEQLRLSYLWF